MKAELKDRNISIIGVIPAWEYKDGMDYVPTRKEIIRIFASENWYETRLGRFL
jgi:hypothetical protein